MYQPIMTKTMQKLIALTALFLLSCIYINTTAQVSKKEARELKKEEQYQGLLELINSEQYAFRGNKANPQKGPQIDLTTRDNFLRIDKGVASADLPYFGRAFSGGYSSAGGVVFDGQMETYDVNKNDKKRRISIKFKVKGKDDTYTCTLTVSGKDNASLSVISNKRQSISYTGMIFELKEEESQEE
jgi:hypothetical protein